MIGRVPGVFRAYFDRVFPERQIYHRRRGHVDFIHVSPIAQVLLVSVTLTVLTWIAYASVNVVFKNQIIDAKDRRIITLEATYENRIAELQAAYDEILGVLSITQERFAESTGALNFRQRQIENMLDFLLATSSDIEGLRREFAVMREGPDHELNRNAILMRLQPEAFARRVSRTPSMTLSSAPDSVSNVLGAVANNGRRVHVRAGRSAEEAFRLEVEEARVRAEQDMIGQNIEESLASQVAHFEAILAATGLETTDLLERFSLSDTANAQGGPLIGLADVGLWERDAEANDSFERQLLRIASTLYRLSTLHMAVSTVPLIQPIDDYRMSSSFGVRRDPFTRQPAFHPGLDFAAARGTPVFAASPGKVVFAGRRSAYGNLVEIDHGFGFRTRYAHLHRINVSKGDTVGLRDQVGTVGSTGRSTGPHLHYEVWFDGELQNPIRFVRAGRHVFEK